MKRLEDYLQQAALRHPDKIAVVMDGASYTYSQLYDAVLARAEQLRAEGVGVGQCVVFRSSQDVTFLHTYFAIHLLGAVAVPLERDAPEGIFQYVSSLASCSTLPPDTADVLFTTGTTGQSKGVMISHTTIVANAENLIQAQGFTPELTFIISGPLNHIASLSKIYPVILVGATLYITPGMKDFNLFYAALDYPSPKMATFLVPTMIRMLLQFSRERLASYAHKIDFIETGAAPISQADMQALCEVLPKSRLFNTYASTETGIISTYNFNLDPCVAGCLGRPMRHANVLITPEGKVACYGKTVMLGYLGAPELTASVLREGVLYTNDNGFLDDNGLLHLSGRDDDVINVGGFKVSPSEIEDVAMALPCIKDCICISTPHPLLSHAPKLLVVLAQGYTLDKRLIARHIASHLESYKVPVAYDQVEQIQRTFNGKLNRKYYR